ncbi:ribosomal RNA small subunit methyltransferase nep-1-like [Herrania umbratica]|uniref:Ribosomal RNA small subunit methyltransferase nep-1-like n=1 Tax=Herrania umbratica TaxID=108875 RepID=A0A6J1ANJ2_9ROSI|nr:ribosomal RNA small subunit methyltransferase nep-1-like [Herrania umbratica]
MARRCTWKRLTRERLNKKFSEQPLPKVQEKEDIKEAAPPPSMPPTTSNARDDIPPPRAIFVIENASLKKGYVGKKWKLLNSDEDDSFLRKQRKNLDDYRPDIVLEVLKEIFATRLNDNDRVRAIFVKTDDGLLFHVKPHLGGFMPLFYSLELNVWGTKLKHSIAGINAGLSYNAEKVMDINDYLSTMADDVTPVFVVGAMVRGKVNKTGTDNYVSRSYTCYSSEMYNVFAADQGKLWFVVAVSNYPLSAAYSTALVCIALANKWELH